MRTFFTLVLLLLTATIASAENLLDHYTWRNRVLLIFTPDQNHPEFVAQNRILDSAGAGLGDRDLVVLRMVPEAAISIDHQPSHENNSQSIYQDFSIKNNVFRVLLIGKDGSIKLTRTGAVSESDLFELIDSMPMRQWEMPTRSSSDNGD